MSVDHPPTTDMTDGTVPTDGSSFVDCDEPWRMIVIHEPQDGTHRSGGLSSAIADSGVWAELTDAIRDLNGGDLPWGRERNLLNQMVTVVLDYIANGPLDPD
jgi:hypothetical protein